MKKYFLSLAILFAFVLPSFSQVRDYVGIVRRQFSDAHLKFEEEAKPVLTKREQAIKDKNDAKDEERKKEKNEVEPEYNEYVDKQSFGSGFVVVLDDGTNIVLTNNHVVANCSKAMIEFRNNNNNEFVIYDNLQVFATSEALDLAILIFPDGNKPFKKGLPLSKKVVSDGDEVWSAGYPGLRNKPEWQLGKGNVTNAKAVVEELMDSKISSIIQHSAPIDAGNSGGPLLEVDSNSANGYSVVGINTWKAYNRELTGFTIPSSVITKFIEDSFNNYNYENGAELVLERSQKFFENLTKSIKSSADLEEYLATPYFDNLPYNYVMNALETVPYYPVKYNYYFSSKLEGRRCLLAYQIWTKYNTLDPKQEDVTSSVVYEMKSIEMPNSNSYQLIYEDSKQENRIVTVWIEDKQQWKICSITYTEDSKKYSLEKKDQKLYTKKYRKSMNDGEGFVHGIDESFEKISVTLPLNLFDVPVCSSGEDKLYKGFALDLTYYDVFNGWAGFGFDFIWQVTDLNYFKLIGIDFDVQCPFDFYYFFIIPSASIGGAYSFFSDAAYYGWYWEGCIDIMFGELADWGIGAGYKTIYLYPVRDNEPNYQIPQLSVYFKLQL